MAEISVNYPHSAGETVHYQWQFLIPEDSQTDSPKNRWWVVGQWHDQPNTTRGENWENFPDHSPPVAIGYAHLNGKDLLGVSYGSPDQSIVGQKPVKRGQWHQIRAVIHWSLSETGWVQIYLDDSNKPFAKAKGRNMHNDFQHYLKLGTYRHPDISAKSRIFLDDLQIQKGAP